MKKLAFMAMLSCMLMACVSNGKRSDVTNESQKDSVVIEALDSDEVVTKDSIDIETYLNAMDSILVDVKKIHIKKAEDTLKYEYLKEKWSDLDRFKVADYDRDSMKHSVKVKMLMVMTESFSEMIRLSKESKAAGISVKEKEIKEFEEEIKSLEKQLWLETH